MIHMIHMILTKRLVIFLGQIMKNTHVHLLHCWEREAYAHKQVGHISVTLDLYTVACYENSHIL